MWPRGGAVCAPEVRERLPAGTRCGIARGHPAVAVPVGLARRPTRDGRHCHGRFDGPAPRPPPVGADSICADPARRGSVRRDPICAHSVCADPLLASPDLRALDLRPAQPQPGAGGWPRPRGACGAVVAKRVVRRGSLGLATEGAPGPARRRGLRRRSLGAVAVTVQPMQEAGTQDASTHPGSALAIAAHGNCACGELRATARAKRRASDSVPRVVSRDHDAAAHPLDQQRVD